ncbi:MAG: hypothetical protein ACYDAG_09860 [Chloroflexota bacterium]
MEVRQMGKQGIADMLVAEAEEAERHRDEPNRPMFRSRRQATDPAQVYSIRMPVAKLERLRRLAAKAEMNPSSLIRQWILERLEEEAHGSRDEQRLRQIVREEVERASRTAAG